MACHCRLHMPVWILLQFNQWWWLLLTLVNVRERRRGRKWEGSMEEFEERRGMLTTGEWCNQVSNMSKKGRVRIRQERFENGGSVYSQHHSRGYTGGRCSPTLSMHFHQDTLLVASYDTGKLWAYSTPSTVEKLLRTYKMLVYSSLCGL